MTTLRDLIRDCIISYQENIDINDQQDEASKLPQTQLQEQIVDETMHIINSRLIG